MSSKDNSLFALRKGLNGEKVIRPGIGQKIFKVRVGMRDKPYEFKELVFISLDWLRKHPRKTYYGIYFPVQNWDVFTTMMVPTCFCLPMQYLKSAVKGKKSSVYERIPRREMDENKRKGKGALTLDDV